MPAQEKCAEREQGGSVERRGGGALNVGQEIGLHGAQYADLSGEGVVR